MSICKWIQGGMMGLGGHAGMDWDPMSGNPRHSNGAYGMAFAFTKRSLLLAIDAARPRRAILRWVESPRAVRTPL